MADSQLTPDYAALVDPSLLRGSGVGGKEKNYIQASLRGTKQSSAYGIYLPTIISHIDLHSLEIPSFLGMTSF
jgi:hypothetical protein